MILDNNFVTICLLCLLYFISLSILISWVMHLDTRYEQFTNTETSAPKKYMLAIMAIFKNESEYMKEWLDHHINQGISHFYLYSNDENMDKYDYLKNYDQLITIIPWTDQINDTISTIQRKAYSHCVKNYGNDCQYLMMLDIDEFLVTKKPVKPDFVINIINTLTPDEVKAIKVPRFNYGSNGYIDKPKDGVFNSYKKREQICSSYKTIANTDFIDKDKNFYGVHDFPFNDKPGKIYNAYFTYAKTGYPNRCTKDDINEIPLVIKHFYTKSYNEYLSRCKLWKDGGVNTVGFRSDCKNKFKENDQQEVDDAETLDFN